MSNTGVAMAALDPVDTAIAVSFKRFCHGCTETLNCCDRTDWNCKRVCCVVLMALFGLIALLGVAVIALAGADSDFNDDDFWNPSPPSPTRYRFDDDDDNWNSRAPPTNPPIRVSSGGDTFGYGFNLSWGWPYCSGQCISKVEGEIYSEAYCQQLCSEYEGAIYEILSFSCKCLVQDAD